MEETIINKLSSPDDVITKLNEYSTDQNLNEDYNKYTKSFKKVVICLLTLNTLLCIWLKYHIKSFSKENMIKHTKGNKIDKSEAKAYMMKKRPNSLLIASVFTIPNIILIGIILKNTDKRREIEDQMIMKTKYEFLNIGEIFKNEENNSSKNN